MKNKHLCLDLWYPNILVLQYKQLYLNLLCVLFMALFVRRKREVLVFSPLQSFHLDGWLVLLVMSALQLWFLPWVHYAIKQISPILTDCNIATPRLGPVSKTSASNCPHYQLLTPDSNKSSSSNSISITTVLHNRPNS